MAPSGIIAALNSLSRPKDSPPEIFLSPETSVVDLKAGLLVDSTLSDGDEFRCSRYATKKQIANPNSNAIADTMPMIIYIPSLLFVDDLFDGGTAVGAAVGGI